MDNVHSPAHYNQGGIETIDAIRAALGQTGFEDHCVGTAIKYLWRWRHKGGLKDLAKARWYLDRLLKEASHG